MFSHMLLGHFRVVLATRGPIMIGLGLFARSVSPRHEVTTIGR